MATPVPNKHDGGVSRHPIAAGIISEDGAISLEDEVVYLTYAGATAITLAAPTNPDMDFQKIEIISQTAQAHVVTATDLINGDNDTLTWGGAIGDCAVLYAYGGEWFTGMLINVTVG